MNSNKPNNPKPRKRFHNTIPWQNKVRRAKRSPSFIKNWRGKYQIIKDGKKVILFAEPFESGGSYGVSLVTKEGQTAGEFCAKKYAESDVLYHRRVSEDYEGYNLGKLGFRLVEQQAKKLDAKAMSLGANQKSLICLALSVGYTITPESAGIIKLLLRYKPSTPLPNNQLIIKKLMRPKVPEDIPRVFLRKQL